MRAMAATLPDRPLLPPGPWTVDDLDDFPEGDTTRYELIDGALTVSAEPSLQNQRVSAGVFRVLEEAAPDDVEVFWPVDVRLSTTRLIAPDVTVVRREDATGRRIEAVPLLVVEVQSPTTRTIDLVLKRKALQDRGVPSYWLVEPDALEVTVLELHDGAYVERARVTAGESVELTQPFPVTLAPGDLVRRR